MLTGIHFLLTYKCLYECEHCFVYGSPRAKGTFTLAKVKAVLQEARKTGTVQTVFFEGGEPFLYYPLLLEAVRIAR
jgi:Predicted Fe-S oxidoreductases